MSTTVRITLHCWFKTPHHCQILNRHNHTGSDEGQLSVSVPTNRQCSSTSLPVLYTTDSVHFHQHCRFIRPPGRIQFQQHCWFVFQPHYGKHVICRVQKSLPSAKFRALGKDLLRQAPHSAKYGTRQRGICRVPGTRQRPALGKGYLCRVPDTR